MIHDRFSGWGDVFFQLGVVDEIARFDVANKKHIDVASVQDARSSVLADAFADGWCVSWKENMPLATITTPLCDEDTLLASYHKDHRRYLKKARKL